VPWRRESDLQIQARMRRGRGREQYSVAAVYDEFPRDVRRARGWVFVP
jgi:hypothetical protein